MGRGAAGGGAGVRACVDERAACECVIARAGARAGRAHVFLHCHHSRACNRRGRVGAFYFYFS